MILVCGEALIDFFPNPAAATGRGALGFEAMPGGSPFNVAVGLARLGSKVAFFSKISTDAFGRLLVERLAEEGVVKDWLVRSDRPTTLSFVTVGADGAVDYVFLGEGAADRSLEPAEMPGELPAEVEALHFGSFSLAVGSSAEVYADLIARESGRRTIAIDINVRPRLVGEMGAYRQRIERLISCSDIIKASTEDIAQLYGDVEIGAIAARWRALGAAVALITRGGDGAVAYTATDEIARPGWAVSVVDTVGAGDTIQAALLAGLDAAGRLDRASVRALDTDTLGPILDRAIVAAAITCSRRGPDLPRLGDLPPASGAS